MAIDSFHAVYSHQLLLGVGTISEGLIVSQFEGDSTPIIASPNTPFWNALQCQEKLFNDKGCVGTAEQ